jgi:hypothetical protein
MEADNANSRLYTLVYGPRDNDHTATMRFVDNLMAQDYARRKLREMHGEKGWTTVAVGTGIGDDVDFIGAWDRAPDGSMTWTPDE